ncbi:MAG: hypothetical protein WCU74_08570 [Candidatus Omnitrophota bacterium]
MNKLFRFVLVFLLIFVSLALIVVGGIPLAILLRMVRHVEFSKLLEYDYSAIWAYQTLAVQPVGSVITSICLVWVVILWICRMRVTTWIFAVLFLINLCVTYGGMPMAVISAAKKNTQQKKPETGQLELAKKKEDARQKLNKISELNPHEQKDILNVLNVPQDSRLIPEWEAFGKRLVNLTPDPTMSASRHYLLGDAIQALAQYQTPDALAAIESIEKELRVTTAPKEKILFSTIYIDKQKAVNPPYQRLTEEVIAKQPEMRRIYLGIEQGIKELQLSGNLVAEAKNLAKQKRYAEAIEKYRQALTAASAYSEEDTREAGRGFVDVLVMAGGSQNLENLVIAIQWQKNILKKGIGIQWVNREIIKLWHLYEYYSVQGQKSNVPIDPNLMELNFKVDGESKRKELEGKYKNFDDKSNLFWDLASYYYSNLDYKEAESVLTEGIRYVQDWKAAGKPINRDKHMEEYMFRDVLKNLYLILGRYDESIEQVKKLKEITANAPKDRYYSERSKIINNAKYDHYILALEYARDHKIPPRELKYAEDINYSFIEFDSPGWVTWNDKCKEL